MRPTRGGAKERKKSAISLGGERKVGAAYRQKQIGRAANQGLRYLRGPRAREGFAPRDPSAASLARGAQSERPSVRHNRTAEPARLPPPAEAVPVLDVEQPLLAPDDQECGDGGEEPDDRDDDPAHGAIGRVAHASAHGLVTSETIHARRVFDGIVQPIDGREGRIPNANSVGAHDAFGIGVRFSCAAGKGRVVGRDGTLGAEEGGAVESAVS